MMWQDEEQKRKEKKRKEKKRKEKKRKEKKRKGKKRKEKVGGWRPGELAAGGLEPWSNVCFLYWFIS